MTRKLKILTCLIIVSTFCFGFEGTWKGGVAKIRITPKQSMWMAGYSSRTTPSDGTYQDLWAKALALRDNQGKQIILITLDLMDDRLKFVVLTRLKLLRLQPGNAFRARADVQLQLLAIDLDLSRLLAQRFDVRRAGRHLAFQILALERHRGDLGFDLSDLLLPIL